MGERTAERGTNLCNLTDWSQPPQIESALAQLEAAELIFRRGIPPDAEYTFKHALVQDAAYSTLLRASGSSFMVALQ